MLQTPLHLLQRVCLAAAPIHLCPSCNPGLYVVPARKRQDLFLEHPIVSSCMRPGTDDRHFPGQDVKKLWKLVNVVRRKMRPTRVTRGSCLTTCLNSHPSSRVVMERNLNTRMVLLLYPCRF